MPGRAGAHPAPLPPAAGSGLWSWGSGPGAVGAGEPASAVASCPCGRPLTPGRGGRGQGGVLLGARGRGWDQLREGRRPCCWWPPEKAARSLWGGGAVGSSHLAVGQRWGRGRAGAREGWPGRPAGSCTTAGGRTEEASQQAAWPRPLPGAGGTLGGGRCPVSGSVGGSGSPARPPSAAALGGSASQRLWASRAAEPLPGQPGGGWARLWVRGLSWRQAGTVAGARGARPPPAGGSRRGPPAARPCAWPAPSG